MRLSRESAQRMWSKNPSQQSSDTLYKYVGINVVGGIREENQRVYFLPKDSSQEVVLYDFTLQVGDSVRILDPSSSFPQAWLTAIDTVSVLGTLRRRFTFSLTKTPQPIPFSVTATIIEGIGRADGDLLLPYSSNYYYVPIGGSITTTLLGFCHNNVLEYGSLDCSQFPLPVVAYPYQPFLQGNSARYMSREIKESTTNSELVHDETLRIYTLNDDTMTRAGHTYRVVKRNAGRFLTTHSGNTTTDSTYTYTPTAVVGGFREENKQVFYWNEAQQREYLYFDYRARKGDTLYVGISATPIEVLAYDTAFVGRKKTWYKHAFVKNLLTGAYSDIYEGVGSLYRDLAEPFIQPSTDSTWTYAEQSGVLSCINDSLVYGWQYQSCDFSLPLPPITDMIIAPNPITSTSTLYFAPDMIQAAGATLTIIGINGQIYYQQPVTTESISLNSSDFPAGMYVCRYTDANSHLHLLRIVIGN